MMLDILKSTQPTVYQTLYNAVSNNRLAHAYIFVGDSTTPKKDTAYFLVKSMLCENDVFACEECSSCKRIEHGNYADMIYIDGNEKSIKKEDILDLKEEFSKTKIEQRGKKVYILDGAEFATPSALNSLLTFLEEPGSDTIAILLVERLEQLLPTIQSRCQIINFRQRNKIDMYHQLKQIYEPFDAYMLSQFGCTLENAQNIMESDEFQHASYIFKGYLDRLLSQDMGASIFLQVEGFGKTKRDQKKVLSYFLMMINVFAKDVLLANNNVDSWYHNSIIKIQPQQAEALLRISCKIRDRNIKSANLNLLVDQFIYEMEGFYE